jgi:hypothetical protein
LPPSFFTHWRREIDGVHIFEVDGSISLGRNNENHARSVGADTYVAKFASRELAATIRSIFPGN